jgi:hypothetical protein
MHTVIETPAFLASAADEGVSEEERAEIVARIAAHPNAGEIMPGTGGARKVRFAGRGKGKSGGYRVSLRFLPRPISRCSCSISTARIPKPTCQKRKRNEIRKTLTALPKAWREQTKAKVVQLRRR